MPLIAERTFHRADTDSPVTARIFAPVLLVDELGPIWSAQVEILGLSEPFAEAALGVDSFQALYTALRRLCARLERHEAVLMFNGRPAKLPIVMPWTGDLSDKPEVYRFIIEKIREADQRGQPTNAGDPPSPS